MIELSLNILTLGSHIDSAKIRVSWRVDHISVDHYDLYRNDELIATIPYIENQKDYEYIDENIVINRRDNKYTYRVEAILKNGNVRESAETSLYERFRIFEYEILRQQEYYFSHIAGAPFLLFNRKHDDFDKCPICWDYTLNRPSADSRDCPLCLGTGILDPYFEPVIIWGIIAPENRIQQAEEIYRIIQKENQLIFNGVPQIFPGDLILDPMNKEYFQVDAVQVIGRPNAGILQKVQLKKTPEQKPEYKWIEIKMEQLDEINEQINEILNRRVF